MKFIKFLLFLILFVLFSCADNLAGKAKKFSQEKIIIDAHRYAFSNFGDRNNTGTNDDITKSTSYHFDYPRAIEGGLNLTFQSIWIHSRTERGTSYDLAIELIEMMNEIIEENPDKFILLEILKMLKF